jgi:hypothetical protein
MRFPKPDAGDFLAALVIGFFFWLAHFFPMAPMLRP